MVCAVGGAGGAVETGGVHTREEATMSMNRLSDLIEDAAFAFMIFSGVVLVAALVATFVL